VVPDALLGFTDVVTSSLGSVVPCERRCGHDLKPAVGVLRPTIRHMLSHSGQLVHSTRFVRKGG
jgi:hypothetical protein